MTEPCAKCGTPMVSRHRWCLTGEGKTWELCCLCTGEMVQLLGGADKAVASR